MSGKTVTSAIILLIIGNALAVFSDAIIKWQGADIPVFQFIFIRALCTLGFLLPFIGQIDRSNLFAGSKVHLVRSHLSLFGIYCMIIALNTLPLATANALFYCAPLLVMVFSVVFFREKLTTLSLVAVVSGFLGIIVILRPLEINWASLSALGVALSLATGAVLIRKLPKKQTLVHSMFVSHIYVLPASLALAIWEGHAWVPALWLTAIGSSLFIMAYHMTVLLAYRHVPANQVTSAEYTGLLSALAVGWLWFQELPDIWFVAGSVMIVGPLVLIGLHERRRTRLLLRPTPGAKSSSTT